MNPKNLIVSALLSGASLLPGIGPAIKSAQKALEDGKIEVHEVEDFIDKAITAIESYTPDKVDVVLESFRNALHAVIDFGEKAVAATKS